MSDPGIECTKTALLQATDIIVGCIRIAKKVPKIVEEVKSIDVVEIVQCVTQVVTTDLPKIISAVKEA